MKWDPNDLDCVSPSFRTNKSWTNCSLWNAPSQSRRLGPRLELPGFKYMTQELLRWNSYTTSGSVPFVLEANMLWSNIVHP